MTRPLDGVRDDLLAKIADRRARIAIIGMGYVGLPLALAFDAAGFAVTGLDIDPQKVRMLNAGETYIRHIGADRVAAMAAAGRFTASTDFAGLGAADAIIICVPTPLTPARDPDMRHVEQTARAVGAALRRGQLVCLESTTYPGTTEELLRPILEAESGLRAGSDVLIAYAPEREDPGNRAFDAAAIPKVIGAVDKTSLTVAAALYAAVVPKVVTVANARTAEAVKLTENVFRAVNIALVNELKLIYGAMDIDVWEVIDAAATKPFGFMPFYPGPGLGGHCIPIDPFYLAWRARQAGSSAKFVELAGEINRAMPDHVLQVLAGSLSRRLKKPLAGARILILGMAYKKNVDDTRESPGLVLFSRLLKEGARVAYHDPHVTVIPPTREHGDLAGIASVPLSPERLGAFDAALVVTDHDGVDLEAVAARVPLIVDTRNAMRDLAGRFADRIVRA